MSKLSVILGGFVLQPPKRYVVSVVILVVLPVRIGHAKEVHIQDALKDEKEDHECVDEVHNYFVAFSDTRGVDVAELTFSIDIVAGLLPRLLLINFGKRTVYSVDILEKSAEHEAVMEELALKFCVIEEHQNEGN